jgi:hypothetical protein
MHYTLSALALLVGLSAQAVELPVKISSFHRPDQNTRMAELCGTVTGTPEQIASAKVRVAVDGAMKGVGIYTTLADESGDFCITLTTYYGRVKVTANAP